MLSSLLSSSTVSSPSPHSKRNKTYRFVCRLIFRTVSHKRTVRSITLGRNLKEINAYCYEYEPDGDFHYVATSSGSQRRRCRCCVRAENRHHPDTEDRLHFESLATPTCNLSAEQSKWCAELSRTEKWRIKFDRKMAMVANRYDTHQLAVSASARNEKSQIMCTWSV